MSKHAECGGSYQSTTVSRFDFSAIAGLPVLVEKMPFLRCSKCSDMILDGQAIEEVLVEVAHAVVAHTRRLTPGEATFLRKRMGFTQSELAKHLGIDRQTVAKWETRGVPISKQHDLLLRAVFLATSAGAIKPGQTRKLLSGLGHVRDAAAPRRANPVIIRKHAA